MEEYKSNSNKSKEKIKQTENKKLDSVVSKGAATLKKKSEFRKIADVFLPEDVSNVKKYIINDILIPNVKNFISDAVDAFLYPDGDGRRYRSRGASRINYNSISTNSAARHIRNFASSVSNRNGLDYDEITFTSRSDALAVLTALEDAIDQFGTVSVGDLYDLAQISTNNYAVNKYGWNDLRSAEIIRVRKGFMIKLPVALPLN